tara:strand:- start:138 stop:605 length:468 start_codon:yes stop_codon:yes gene_type:complete
MADFDLKKSYETLVKKHKLPSFEELNSDFELEFIDKKPFLLRSIRRKLNEKVIFYCRIIEGVLFPNAASYISAVEEKALTDDDKKEILGMYRQLMVLERRSLRLDVGADDKQNVSFIIDVTKIWKKYSKTMDEFIQKMEEAWKKEETQTPEGFFG